MRRFLREKTGLDVKVCTTSDICHPAFQLLLHYCCLKTTPVIVSPLTVSGGQDLGRGWLGLLSGLWSHDGWGQSSRDAAAAWVGPNVLIVWPQRGQTPGEPRVHCSTFLTASASFLP